MAEISVSLEEGVTMSATAKTTCKTVSGNAAATNIYGKVMWRLWQKVDWCYSSGGKITKKSVTIWPEIGRFVPLWVYKGATQKATGGVGYTYYQNRAQGTFSLSVVGYAVQTLYPIVDIKVNANGTSSIVTSNN